MAKFTNEEFVDAWQEADSVDAAAKKLGVSRHCVETTRTKLRRLGVQLKTFASADMMPRGKPDVSVLNARIEKAKPKFADGTEVSFTQVVSIAIDPDDIPTERGATGVIQHYLGDGRYMILVDEKYRTGPDNYAILGGDVINTLQLPLSGVA